jgi:hypothetical protein
MEISYETKVKMKINKHKKLIIQNIQYNIIDGNFE